MNKQEKIISFNPNDVGLIDNNIFGLPFDADESDVIIIPVPWDVTVSYKPGTSLAPEAIFEASMQVDLYNPFYIDGWKRGIYMEKVADKWLKACNLLRKKAEKYIQFLSEGKKVEQNKRMQEIRYEINKAGKELNDWLKEKTADYLKQNKLVIVLGGDHSSPLGFIDTLSAYYKSFGILHIDAHADLRNAYEGFTYSHASIMFNALKNNNITKLVQVGIRDYCQEEILFMEDNKPIIKTFFDADIHKYYFEGKTWLQVCNEIISQLPDKVYISLDIDGLDPKYCPETGTPVPGGLTYNELVFLLQQICLSGRKIIGADLCEVGNAKNDWDANVGARILFQLTHILLKSNPSQ